jgi:hypothetical protein
MQKGRTFWEWPHGRKEDRRVGVCGHSAFWSDDSLWIGQETDLPAGSGSIFSSARHIKFQLEVFYGWPFAKISVFTNLCHFLLFLRLFTGVYLLMPVQVCSNFYSHLGNEYLCSRNVICSFSFSIDFSGVCKIRFILVVFFRRPNVPRFSVNQTFWTRLFLSTALLAAVLLLLTA